MSTPIGNLDDITNRAVKIIDKADFVICENPKHSLKLLNKLGIKKKLIALHDYNEDLTIKKLAKNLHNGNVVLISDAGSPLISDPGYKLIRHCLDNNLKITSIPGPTSIIPALQLSGIPINEFSFFGFFPKTKNDILVFIDKVEKCERTSVFFVSSHKIITFLEQMDLKMKNREISVAKELTKINERIFRGSVHQVKEKILSKKENLKGEFVVVLSSSSKKTLDVENLTFFEAEIKKLLLKFSLTDVVEIVHKLTGITKNKVYKWVLKTKKF